MWRIVANGPIADAYSYAVAANVPNPGKDEAVVTDAATSSTRSPPSSPPRRCRSRP
jgi:hypothetical protein